MMGVIIAIIILVLLILINEVFTDPTHFWNTLSNIMS